MCVYIYIYMYAYISISLSLYIYIYIYVYIHNANGAAAKVHHFDRLGKKVRPGTFWKNKYINRRTKQVPLSKNMKLLQ